MELLRQINEYSIISPEIIPMIYDIIRTLIINVVVQILFYMNNPGVQLFSGVFFQTTVFLVLGIIIFWLIIYKLLSNNYFNIPLLYHNHRINHKINHKNNIKE